MELLQPVAWIKGTFLTPQHLQAQDAYFENLLRFRLNAACPWPWGFVSVAIDLGQLEQGLLVVRSASGLFPDGLAFSIPDADAGPGPRDLKTIQDVPVGQSLEFVLAVPSYRHSAVNMSASAQDSVRFRIGVRELADDCVGGRGKPIQLAVKNFLLLTVTEAGQGYSQMAVARVRKTGPATWAADPDFIPPSLKVSSSPRLQAIASDLAYTLLARSDALAVARKQRNGSLASFTAVDAARFWLLYTVNSIYPVLRHMSASPVHPSDLYSCMLGLAGSLTTFSSDVRPADLPLYDHANQTDCFSKLDGIIRHLLETVIPSNSFMFPLRKLKQSVWGTALDSSRYLPPGVSVWLGVRSASARSQEVLRDVPSIVKITSGAYIDNLYGRALGGVALKHDDEPDALFIKSELQYFRLNPSGEDWDRVVREKNMAVYVPDSILDPVLELIVVLPDEVQPPL